MHVGTADVILFHVRELPLDSLSRVEAVARKPYAMTSSLD
jgi:hypothetical protein